MFNYIDNIIKNTYIKEHKKNYLNKKKCKITIVDNGIVLPVRKVNNQDLSQGAGGVIDSKLNYIKSSTMLAKNMKDRVNGKYNIDTDNIDYMDETVVYGNAFYKHWGHFLIDIVSRLWYLIDHPKYKVVFIVEESSDINIDGNYLELLELFGIKKETSKNVLLTQ